ncbi:MAG: DinB family protein [Chloroflexi bacterium]|nr:DinB family protein [Chloroflexota bacterium]
MSATAQRIVNSLEREGKKTLEFFEALQPQDWSVEVYSDGDAWKVHNLLAHFTEVEGSISKLIERILKGDPGVPQDFDIDRWNARYTMEMSELGQDYLMAEFARRRVATVEMARGLTNADLEVSGRHPFLGPSQVKDMLKLMYLHLQIHQRDIRSALDRPES